MKAQHLHFSRRGFGRRIALKKFEGDIDQRNGDQRQRERDGNIGIDSQKIGRIHMRLLSKRNVTSKHTVPSRKFIVNMARSDEVPKPVKFGAINMAAYHAAARLMERPDTARIAAFWSFLPENNVIHPILPDQQRNCQKECRNADISQTREVLAAEIRPISL